MNMKTRTGVKLMTFEEQRKANQAGLDECERRIRALQAELNALLNGETAEQRDARYAAYVAEIKAKGL